MGYLCMITRCSQSELKVPAFYTLACSTYGSKRFVQASGPRALAKSLLTMSVGVWLCLRETYLAIPKPKAGGKISVKKQ